MESNSNLLRRIGDDDMSSAEESIILDHEWEDEELELLANLAAKNFIEVRKSLIGVNEKLDDLPCNGMAQKVEKNTRFRARMEEQEEKEKTESLLRWKAIGALSAIIGVIVALSNIAIRLWTG